MKIGALKEIFSGEKRVALTPDSATHLQKLGHECLVEKDAGLAAGFSDTQYMAVGVEISTTAEALTKASDVIVKVRPPSAAEINRLSSSKTLISFFYPSANEALMELAKSKEVCVIAMDMVPRISRAQKMDALSSMANIAGYRAVIEAGNNFGRFFTGQMTAAGKVPPAKVLVVGAGVAGLAAIGTSTSLGATHFGEALGVFDLSEPVTASIDSTSSFIRGSVGLNYHLNDDTVLTAGAGINNWDMSALAKSALDTDIRISTNIETGGTDRFYFIESSFVVLGRAINLGIRQSNLNADNETVFREVYTKVSFPWGF